MTRDLRRSAEHHEVMSAIYPCPKPAREKKQRKATPRRKVLEGQLEAIVKMIVFWRDSQMCVQQATDGARCGNGLTWGHYIAQKQSAWLRYDLGNSFCQCGNHNLLDFHGDKSYATWYTATFGQVAAEAMQAEARAHSGKPQRTIQELEMMLAQYDTLYQDRFFAPEEIGGRVAAGYYGTVIGTPERAG